MGFFDDVVEVVTDAAEKVEKGAEWVGKVAKKVGLDKIAQVAVATSKFAGKLAVAPTPVLQKGQKLIERMHKATGDGDPERAKSFGDAARKFQATGDTLAKAHPGQGWEGGTASKAYDERTSDQESRVATLADADSQVAAIVSREADQINDVRKILDYNHQLLADVGAHTQYLGTLGPEGKALQYSIETFYVAMAMDQCVPKMWQMHNEANENAAAIRNVRGIYQQVASGVTISDSSGDFNPKGLPPMPAPRPGQPSSPTTPAPAPRGFASASPLPAPGGSAPPTHAQVPSAPTPAMTPEPGTPTAAANFRGRDSVTGMPPSQVVPTAGQRATPATGPGGPAAARPVSRALNDIDGAASGTTGERAPIQPASETTKTVRPSETAT
jgi:hypothetical protein